MVIRDNVYGDIEIPSKFARLVNTCEFQRLRRIKQLATADHVFPGATHSRFSHSIGTYYIMTKILMHFEKILKAVGEEQYIKEEEKDAILAAALLHDIGHGPFSHAFEMAKISSNHFTHEEWTIKIIENEQTEVNKELKKWGEEMPQKVIEYINYRSEVKKGEEESLSYIKDGNRPDFKFIFMSLVSSQLDADRMDYLLRDSFNCGVPHGKFDSSNLIEGMSIAIAGDGKFRVCIKKNYLAIVEEYFYARYQMYRNIYYHPEKVLSEKILEKILNRACNYFLDGKLPAKDIPPLIREIFEHADISLEHFKQLDDTVVMGAIHTWSLVDKEKVIEQEDDERKEIDKKKVLRILCNEFLYGSGYKRVQISDSKSFEGEIKELFEENNVPEEMQELIFIECNNQVYMYNKTNDESKDKSVYILDCSGKIKKLEQVSGLMGESISEQTIYYNRKFAELSLGKAGIEKLESLIEQYDIIHALEIEKKYLISESMQDEVYEKIVSILEKLGYTVEKKGVKEQKDFYYDTFSQQFYKEKSTLRIREKEGKFYLTVKSSSDSDSSGDGGQLERHEIEKELHKNDLEERKIFINSYFQDFFERNNITFGDLKNNIIIHNKRRKINVSKSLNNEYIAEEKYEIVFDNVQYENIATSKIYSEAQMEIELKSSIETRINMKRLTDELEAEIQELVSISDSKYCRAIKNTI